MNRKSFIQSQGATCANWTWSWSFINVEKRTIIFGAWDKYTEGSKSLIFSEAWATNPAGRKKPAYRQSREHIRLVEEEGYKLLTFPMIFSDELKDEDGSGPSKIKGFQPVLTAKSLVRAGGNWYAFNGRTNTSIPEEVQNPEKFVEGAAKTIAVNAYERNSKARSACIKHYGAVCAVCDFNFEAAYGAIGKDFIHVHHIVPLSEIRREYELDPVRDLIPICPNCHAVIHLTQPAMSIEELRICLTKPRDA
ncbi:HNH endonuclease [Chromobacterium paludis]|uniref:HNH endonuclease n=1 Tax=Chromobacterium paludis TaxID=2605945 RepID=A0A5C1DJ61_9NEIS|nr:HNH endonuclease [Chromobacterium paludis]QEL55999.1 HNH endonuclease [Chromobacterium paludis]